MSLAEHRPNGTPIVDRQAQVLILDIERLPGVATVDFWDLNDYKGRRIHADCVDEWPRTICAAWSWYGHKKVEFAAEWEDGGRDQMLRRTWQAYDDADIVVGHNLGRFDSRKLKGDWKLAGMPMPSPWKTVDTLAIARREYSFESNTLDALCKRFGLDGKNDRYNAQVARDAVNGKVSAQRRIKRYNQEDVRQSILLYDALRGNIPTHPHLGSWGDDRRCPQCGSDDLKLLDKRYKANVLEYAAYQCQACLGYVRGTWEGRLAATRGIN